MRSATPAAFKQGFCFRWRALPSPIWLRQEFPVRRNRISTSAAALVRHADFKWACQEAGIRKMVESEGSGAVGGQGGSIPK